MIIWTKNQRLPSDLYHKVTKTIKLNHNDKEKYYTTYFVGAEDEKQLSFFKNLSPFYDELIADMTKDLGVYHKSKYTYTMWMQMSNSDTDSHLIHSHFQGFEQISWVHFINVPDKQCFYFYNSREEYLSALADVMQAEYETIIKEGLYLQLDCPDLALSRHMLFSDLSDDDFVKIAELHVETLNYALRNIPHEKVRIHICWGNYEGPHCCDIDMNKVFSTLMKAKAQFILFETSNPRHAHEWEVFENRRSEIPDDKILVPGVIDTTTNFVEHPNLVRQRIEKFIKIVGRDRVVAGTDCGFGTFAGFGTVDPEIAYAKLAALSKGASLIL